MPSYIYRTRQAAPGQKPLKVNVKRLCVPSEHNSGDQFDILHHGCSLGLHPNHQGSTQSFGVPEAVVCVSETSKNMAGVSLCFLKYQALLVLTLPNTSPLLIRY